ncbi:MAG: acetyl-CoA decarbonylase/synthase complex subunit alpha/beta [Dehalococcoidales bacterium]|jgi:acetyl-CoA synthase|nr:acetyl-CoA decarbonylase/synthase complex subunit alpha/beta [Dehalococcoidales bacterium]
MSKIIASAAIRGARKIYDQAEKKWREAMDKWGANEPVGFPNTAYYLPVIYGILGEKVERLGDMEKILRRCQSLLPPPVKEEHPLPYLAPALDAGMATFFAEELIEAIRYLEQPDFYLRGEDIGDGNIWLGAANDIILRKRGIEFVDGTAPGFAAVLGAAPTNEIAVKIAQELQQKNIYVFMAADYNGKKFSEQLVEAGVQIGWPTRLVSFGPDVSSTVFAMGFATRAALSFGGIEPGEHRKVLIYNKDRIFAFALPLGYVTDEWYANAAGAINFGFPTIADTPIPQVLPTGITTYEHVISNIPHDDIVAKAIETRGLKIAVTELPIPVAFGPAFEGERVRGEDIYLEAGGGRTPMVEWVTSRRMDEVEDGKIEVIGPEVTDIQAGTQLPLSIAVEVAGRNMQEDYEPILERQLHHLINYAQGLMHIGQRDIAWLRVSKQAVEKGFKLSHIGTILHTKLHQDFGRIFDKLQVKLYTEEVKVKETVEKAKTVYATRDTRIEGMTDETTDIYYSCTLCQSFAPSHVCVISPERTGLCGSYNWMDCKAAYEINPTGPNQPVPKGDTVDAKLGQWQGVNEFVIKTSRGKIDHYNFYSLINDPMTTCGCCECIAAILPLCNGIMTVNREYMEETPCGMKFTTLAGTIGGGISTPGFVGHGKYNITQRKFITGDGGLIRIVWMPKMLKEEIAERLKARAEEMGVPDLLDMIADETIGVTEETILPFLQEKGHPALTMESLLG